MSVVFERGGGVGVAEARGDGYGVDVVGQEDGGVGVAPLVEGDIKAVIARELAEPL